MYKKIGLFICRHFVLGDKFQQIPGGEYTPETGSTWHYCCSSDSCKEIIHRRDKILCVHRRDEILYVTSELLLYLQIQEFLLFMQNDKQNRTGGNPALDIYPGKSRQKPAVLRRKDAARCGVVNLVTQGDAIHLHVEEGLRASGPWQRTPINVCSWELPLLQGKEAEI